jgi:hypothetical protein
VQTGACGAIARALRRTLSARSPASRASIREHLADGRLLADAIDDLHDRVVLISASRIVAATADREQR